MSHMSEALCAKNTHILSEKPITRISSLASMKKSMVIPQNIKKGKSKNPGQLDKGIFVLHLDLIPTDSPWTKFLKLEL